MRISILLPYKENFSPNYAGAVSLFVKDTTNKSRFKKKFLINHISCPLFNFKPKFRHNRLSKKRDI